MRFLESFLSDGREGEREEMRRVQRVAFGKRGPDLGIFERGS